MSNDVQKRFINEALAAHNEYRKLHGVPPLVHNPEISKISMNYCKKIAAMDQLTHSKNTYNGEPLGENLAMWFSTGADHYDGKQASKQWYDEVKDYNFKRPGFSMGTGHFTQLVWKNSKEVGFGVAVSPQGYFYAVANYYPPGNYNDEYAENVLPLGTNTSKTSSDYKGNNEKKNVVNRQPTIEDNEWTQRSEGEFEKDGEAEEKKTGCC